MAVDIPPLPATPPDLLNPPDPSVDAHAYNWWLAKTQNYKWLLAQHQASERLAEQRAARELAVEAMHSFTTGVADICDALEKGREVKAADVFMELLRKFDVRPGDTDANIPGQIDKTVRPLLAQLQQYRSEGA